MDITLLKEKAAVTDKFICRPQAGDAALERCQECKCVFLSTADKLQHKHLANHGEVSAAVKEKQVKLGACLLLQGRLHHLWPCLLLELLSAEVQEQGRP